MGTCGNVSLLCGGSHTYLIFDVGTFYASPQLIWRGSIYVSIEMKKDEHNVQLGIPTLGFISAHVAHMRHFM